MGGEIADGVDEAIAVLAYMSKVRSLPITALGILQQPEIVLSGSFCQVSGNREKELYFKM